MERFRDKLKGIWPKEREPWEKSLGSVPKGFEFSEEAKDVLRSATQLTAIHGDRFTNTSHLALVLADEPSCAEILQNLGVEVTEFRSDIGSYIGFDPLSVERKVNFSPQAQRAIKWAVYEATLAKRQKIAPLDLLTGITYVDCVETEILENYGVGQETLRAAIEEKTWQQRKVDMVHLASEITGGSKSEQQG